MSSPGLPRITPLPGPFGEALSIDVEEWYHTCFVPSYVDPARRPPLVEELDWLLPEVLALLAEAGRTATFFVLGEVAARLPARIREVADAGHELACHSDLHFRVTDRTAEDFAEDLCRAKARIEDACGVAVVGYRAPEWSLRSWRHPYLPLLARHGFRYDASLPRSPGSGRADNPAVPSRLDWPEQGLSLIEVPPLSWAGPLRLPACGWTGRLVSAERIARAAEHCRRSGGLPVMTVHPWELSTRPTPGRLTGAAWWFHEIARRGYRPKFERLLRARAWRRIDQALALDDIHQPAGRTSEP